MFLFNCDHSYFKTFNHRSLTLSNSSQRAFFLLFSFSVYDLIILTTNDETPNIATAAPTSWALSDTDCFEPRKWWVLIIDLVNEAISKILVHHDTRICLCCTIGQKAITPINAFKFASIVFCCIWWILSFFSKWWGVRKTTFKWNMCTKPVILSIIGDSKRSPVLDPARLIFGKTVKHAS